MYFKRIENDISTSANEIVGPGWRLDGSDKTATHDGWMWFDTAEEAYRHFGKTDTDAERWQVRVWLARQGVNPATIPAIIESMTEDGPQRWEALERWHTVTRVPITHPMVPMLWAVVSPGLGRELTLEQAWEEILAL